MDMIQKVVDVIQPNHRVVLVSKLQMPQELEEVKDELDKQIIDLTHKLTNATFARGELVRKMIEDL